MKQYKLIKTYPGSPNLGFIVKYTELMSEGFFCTETNCWTYQIEKYPEFWQEIIENPKKDYEITAFRCIKNGILRKLSYTGKYHNNNDNGQTLEFCLKTNDNDRINNSKKIYEIYSVKRLSDGIEFKIGDKIIDNGFNDAIESFELYTHKITGNELLWTNINNELNSIKFNKFI